MLASSHVDAAIRHQDYVYLPQSRESAGRPDRHWSEQITPLAIWPHVRRDPNAKCGPIIASGRPQHKGMFDARRDPLSTRRRFTQWIGVLEIRPKTLRLESSAASRISLGKAAINNPYKTVFNSATVQTDVTQRIPFGLAPSGTFGILG